MVIIASAGVYEKEIDYTDCTTTNASLSQYGNCSQYFLSNPNASLTFSTCSCSINFTLEKDYQVPLTLLLYSISDIVSLICIHYSLLHLRCETRLQYISITAWATSTRTTASTPLLATTFSSMAKLPTRQSWALRVHLSSAMTAVTLMDTLLVERYVLCCTVYRCSVYIRICSVIAKRQFIMSIFNCCFLFDLLNE